MPARSICVGAVQSVLIWKHIWLGQEAAAERGRFQICSPWQCCPSLRRTGRGQGSSVTLVHWAGHTQHHNTSSREAVTLSKQGNRRNTARGAATTKRICEKREIKETEVVGKEDYDRGWVTSRPKRKNYVICIQIYFIKIATCSVFSQHYWMPGMMQLRYQGAVHR